MNGAVDGTGRKITVGVATPTDVLLDVTELAGDEDVEMRVRLAHKTEGQAPRSWLTPDQARELAEALLELADIADPPPEDPTDEEVLALTGTELLSALVPSAPQLCGKTFITKARTFTCAEPLGHPSGGHRGGGLIWG